MSDLNNISFSRLFVVEGQQVHAWATMPRRDTTFVLCLESGFLTLDKKSGRDPLGGEVVAALHHLIEEFNVVSGEKISRHNRTNRYRFVLRTGYTGCEDVFIEEDILDDGYPRRHRIFHTSMYGKVPNFRCFAPDFFDYLVGEGLLLLDEEGHYTPFSGVAPGEGWEMECLPPRLLQYEEGWVAPWEKPPKPVDLRVCREVPEPEVPLKDSSEQEN